MAVARMTQVDGMLALLLPQDMLDEMGAEVGVPCVILYKSIQTCSLMH